MVKLQPKLRFREFNDTWLKVDLNDIAFIYDGTHQTPKYTSEGVPFVSVESIDNIDSPSKFISKKAFESDFKIKPQKNDILMTRITAGVIGATAIVRNDNPLAFYVSLALIRLKQNGINVEFLNQVIKSSSFRQELHKRIIHIAFPKKINLNEIGLCKVFYCSVSEQTKIASFLSAVDEKLNLLKQKKAALEEYKKGMMQKIFSQEIRFKDENGKDFAEWEEKVLKDFMEERNIQSPKSNEYPLMSFVAYKGVTQKGDRYNREFLVNDEKNKKYKQTEYGDFIYSSNNLETGSIGLNNFGSASISPVYSIFKINTECDYKFISNYLGRKEFISKMTRFRQGVVYGQWRIHEKDFLQLSEKLPCFAEQTKIASFLSAIDEKIELISTQIEETQEYKKGLLQQMFC